MTWLFFSLARTLTRGRSLFLHYRSGRRVCASQLLCDLEEQQLGKYDTDRRPIYSLKACFAMGYVQSVLLQEMRIHSSKA